jgi:hypothetical protein
MADVLESIGYGDTVHIEDGAGPSYVLVDNLVDFDPPNEVLQTVQSKRLSMASRRLIRIPTIYDPGETRLMVNLSQAGRTRFKTLLDNRTLENWKFTLTDDTSTTVIIVAGYVTSMKFNRVVADEIVNYEVTIGHTGVQS